MASESSIEEVDHLAALLREDALEPEDSKRLVELIRHHPRARRRLVEHLYLDADLRDAVPTLESMPSAKVVSPIVFRGAIAGLAIAAVLAVVMVVKSMLLVEPTGSGELVTNSEAMDSAGIAVVSKTSEVRWGEGTTIPVRRLENGSPVGPGVLEVEAGMVQIDFYSGATVILRGPARLRLESPERGHLDYGNLWAHVPPPARGFRVETSGFDVVDLGTEFGMRVGKNGQGEVHVLDGEVELSTTQGNETLKDHSLKTGEGMRMEEGKKSVEIPADPNAFPESKQLSGAVKMKFRKWRVFQEALEADSDMWVSYTFPQIAAWERTVVNGARSAPGDTDGAIVGCEWTEGRWPGKGALAYSNSSHRLRLNLPGKSNDLTMACWVKLNEVAGHSALLHPETNSESFVHWTLIRTAKDRVHLHFAQTEGQDRLHYHCDSDLFRKTGSSWGEWMHLAVVYDSKNHLVTHYQDGKVIGTNAIETPRSLEIGTVDIGNWPYKEWAAGTDFEERNLNGALDEFLIMKRAWSAAEIEGLWRVGRP